MSSSAIRSVNAPDRVESPRPGAIPARPSGTLIDLGEARRRREAEADDQAAPRTRVRIYRLDGRPKQHGLARPWVLEFEPTTATRTDPLMGWIGWSDPRQQVRLLFSTKARAVAFAERQGWACDVIEPPQKSAGLMDEIRQAAARPISAAGVGDWHAVM